MSVDTNGASSTGKSRPPDAVDRWLVQATDDVERRGLSVLKPLLESLAAATRALRGARLSGDADRRP